ncbi:NADH-quinone oxidoreductase subunit I [Peptococcaceae bacterium 1198_IL3148]
MYGSGLIKGLSITLKEFFTKKVTVEYPDEIYPLPDRFHGRFTFDKDACISCGMCVRSCPNRVITLETETVAKKKRILKYEMDIKYCMFCGMCVEACPKGALGYAKDFELCQYKWGKLPMVFVEEQPLPPEERARLEEAAKKEAEAKKAALEAAKAKAAAAKDSSGKEG